MTIFYRRLPRFEYLRPGSLDEVLSLLAEHGRTARLLAGGTDLLPQLKRREVRAPQYVIDLKGVSGLDGISYDQKEGIRIGPLTTIAAIERFQEARTYAPSLVDAAASMASPQVRNRGTFAGNICSAVPSADSAPALLVLNATVELKSVKGERTLPIEEFFIGPRQTALREDEMLVGIRVPAVEQNTGSLYLKLSPRHAMDLAVVGVAVAASSSNGVCKQVKIALGAVAPTPVRSRRSEEVLEGKAPSEAVIEEASQVAVTQCNPIDDHRASAEYRCDMIYTMTKRALTQVLLGGKQ